jgi:hypothetical protein
MLEAGYATAAELIVEEAAGAETKEEVQRRKQDHYAGKKPAEQRDLQ